MINDPLGDIPLDDLRRGLRRSADLIADYLEGVSARPVTPACKPGDVRRGLPPTPPREGEPLDVILDDFGWIADHSTHWPHPGFLAYFAASGSGPGVIAEALAAGLNVNAMLWRTGPAATELEGLACDWLRGMMGLPPTFQGHINDTASVSTLVALAAARSAPRELRIRERGMSGRPDLPELVIYASEHAHSSVDRAALTLGLGLSGVRKIAADAALRMNPAALDAAICADRAAGRRPLAVVATAGTTSTAAIDPCAAIAAICRREELWLHVDAAYGGAAAICEEMRPAFAGMEQADSIVMNPHKWLFVPIDSSVLFVREPGRLREAFSLVPEYLKTQDGAEQNLMDLGVALGRRFRALKLWMVIRAFGSEGLARRVRRHCAMAAEFAAWIGGRPELELAAPPSLGVVCFRVRAGDDADERTQRLLAHINADGAVFLSHTRLAGRLVIRVAINGLRTTDATLDRLKEITAAAIGRK
jgi:aromatic-L-amino-acid/L-tryptophan decarboxylase